MPPGRMYELQHPHVAATIPRGEASSHKKEGPVSDITETAHEDSDASGRTKGEGWA